MTLVAAPPAELTESDLREVVTILRAGLDAGRWTPRVYDLLAAWCDHVEEVLDEGDLPADAMPVPAPTRGPTPPAPRPPAPAARPHPTHPARRRPPSRPPRAERPGQLHCPRHDGGAGQWLPIAAFRPRADRPGKYQSWCRECTNAYAARKYLSADTLRALVEEGVLVASLPADSPLLREPCPRCNEAWCSSDVIVSGGPVVAFHKECVADA